MSLNTGRWITIRGNIGRKLNKGVTLLKKENMQVRAAVDEYTDFWNRAIVTHWKYLAQYFEEYILTYRTYILIIRNRIHVRIY